MTIKTEDLEARKLDQAVAGIEENELGGHGKFRFNSPIKGQSSKRWFIGVGEFDESKSQFTGDLTLDFEHHFGSDYKGFIPKCRIEIGGDVERAFTFGNLYYGFDEGYTVGAVSLPVVNVTRLDLDVEVASGFTENPALTSAELRPDSVSDEDRQVRPRG